MGVLVKTQKIYSYCSELKKTGVPDEMLQETVQIPEKFCEPFIEKLVKLLKDERFYRK